MFLLASILSRVENLMGTWGYLMLFTLLFSCGVGVPLPEDIPLLLAGYFIANGKMHLVIAGIVAWLGIIGGDCVLYSFGYRYGMLVTKLPVIGKHVSAKRIQYAERLFQKFGVGVVAVGRMFAGIRGAMVIAAGTIRYSFWKFLIADGLGAIVSGGLFVALGYWAGKKLGNLESLREKIQHYEHYVITGLALIIIAAIAWKWLRKKLHRPILDEAMEKAVQTAESIKTPSRTAEIAQDRV